MKSIVTPITDEVIKDIKTGDMVYLSGYIYTGRDAVLPKVVKLIETGGLKGAVIPPVTALLESKILKREVVAFPEEGMEAMHLIKVDKFPIIIAAAHGESLYK